MSRMISDQIDELRTWFAAREKVVVAYSGGVDSSLVMCVAHEALGDHCMGVMAVSPSLPEAEKKAALLQAETLGWKIRVIETGETEADEYQVNSPNRCFHCKDHVYRSLYQLAEDWAEEAVLVDGMNADDTLDLRPGRAAAMKHGVRSPLNELGFTKTNVREAARSIGLSVWDKPAAACLASRIPYGTRVTHDLLRRVENAEAFVKALGFSDLRVRHHGDLARIEVPSSELELAIQHTDALVGGLKSLGWLYVTLDMEGLRQGSMNAPLFIRS